MNQRRRCVVTAVFAVLAACVEDNVVLPDAGTNDAAVSGDAAPTPLRDSGRERDAAPPAHDASVTDCASGAKRCQGATPQTCNAQGNWIDGVTCEFGCTSGACSGACTPSAKRCEGRIPQACSQSKKWVNADECPFVCSAGECTGACTPASKRCSDLTPQTCSAAGAWTSATTCEHVCSDGNCSGACTPNSTRCVDLTPQSCSASGQWVSGTSCDYVCTNGNCSGACTPSSKQCSGLTPQTCSNAGAWVGATDCDYVCSDGDCSGVCTPSGKQCSGLTPQTCSNAGAWVDGTDCDYVCDDDNGDCSGVCTPSSKQCSGLTPQTCNVTGDWEDGTDCDYLCDDGECSGECVPGSKQCTDASNVKNCDLTGTWVGSACLQVCEDDACRCSPRYTGDGTTCTPIDFCAAPAGGCSPNALCSQLGVTPSCTCNQGYLGDGLGCSTPAQTRITEGFEDLTMLATAGWSTANNSVPLGTTTWFQGGNPFTSHTGAALGYIGANYQSTTTVGTISTWLLTPTITFGQLASFSLYTRSVVSGYPDRIEMRLCTAMPCPIPTGSATATTGYETLLLSINPNLVSGGYPTVWTQFTINQNLPAAGTGRIAIRYFVTLGGSTGANSDYIGVDDFVASSGDPAYPVSGTVTGLTTAPLSLWLNGLLESVVTVDGSFSFTANLSPGTPYSIAVFDQPAGQTCTVSNATGTIGTAAITDVAINCAAD